MPDCKVAVIGGGVLGTSIAYFLSGQAKDPNSVILLEQERNIGQHTSSRNTGKVHAPFLYDPVAKKTFAKAASLGYKLWSEYAAAKDLVFKRDGVLEVALDEKGIERLNRYTKWGEANGLGKGELQLLNKKEVAKLEPNVRCESALYCSKDASVDYGALTLALHDDLKSFGCRLSLGNKVEQVAPIEGGYRISTSARTELNAEFVVNAAGGNSMDIAHSMGVAGDYGDLHFRGEYWQAPPEYRDLTRHSIYSVPRHPEYPFLDPHWIVRADGRCEVGPNAVPVFGPYAYSWKRNLADMVPKLIESSRSGARKTMLDREFVSLALGEVKSSLSKRAMIARAREFLPALRASAFTKRGTSGIRSSVVDRKGRFLPDTLVHWAESSVHVLNYNSPGATGALPMAAKVVAKIMKQGRLAAEGSSRSLWDAASIADRMEE